RPPRLPLNDLLPPRSPPLPPRSLRGNLSPEGSTFSQTRPDSRSNTPVSTPSGSRPTSPANNQQYIQQDFSPERGNIIQYRPLIERNIVEPDEQLLINFDNSINNDQEVEEHNEEEDQPIDIFNENNLRQFLAFINAPEEQVIEVNHEEDEQM